MSEPDSWLLVRADSPFPMENLPFGIASTPGGAPGAVVAIGDHALALAVLADAGMLDGIGVGRGVFAEETLNRFLGLGRDAWQATRARLTELLIDRSMRERVLPALVRRATLSMRLPIAIGDYVDFYSSIHHATNLGRLFRPDDEPLLPSWRRLPMGYHGRSGTVIASDETVFRPSGLVPVDGEPVYQPSSALDLELEVGFVVGFGNARGAPIPIGDTAEHLFGACIVNDWSARDIQAYEYQPLGPFLGKSFATSMSHWIVTLDALEPYRVAQPEQIPAVEPYLVSREPWGFDLELEAWIQSGAMRLAGMPAVRVSATRFADMYWTPAQQLAHITANGASTRPGDLLASGTVSGPDRGTEGSLIEATWRGERPIDLPDGTTRTFLLDGDRVVLRGWAGGDGRPRIGLGEVVGRVVGTVVPHCTEERG